MGFQLLPITAADLPRFKADMQEAFQKGFEDVFGAAEGIILPEKDIDRSLDAVGSAAYKAVVDGVMVGGAVVVINEQTHHNHLDLLYVQYGTQTKGIGHAIWTALEALYPDTVEWETCTPYFERRNIHFYVNKCGFSITEFHNQFYPDPNDPEDFIGDGGEGMFVFKKKMV